MKALFAWLRPVVGVLVLVAAAVGPAAAQDTRWGGSLRTYLFLELDSRDDQEESRRDTELALLRVTNETRLNPNWRLVTHGVLEFRSPPAAGVPGLADTTGPTFLPLDGTLVSRGDGELRSHVDRLHVDGSLGVVRVVAGRQAITWGTNYFWPALDLFAPFRPFQVDRDYKPGVDAVRATVPLGSFSEFEAVGAVMGSSANRDGAGAALARIHLGRTDVGVMAGYFHGDTVAGGFVTSDLAGTGWRAEVTHTSSGDDRDRLRRRSSFWRGSVGLDRMISPVLMVTAELAWNGFGESDPSLYPMVAGADRVRRGEVNALGRRHAGLSLEWEPHPLWKLGNTLLANLDDPSALWVPTLRWSTGNDTEVLFGAQVPVGPGLGRDGLPRSEYGLAATTVFVGFTGYFW